MVKFSFNDFKFIGCRWKFVPKRFVSPPREFKKLYGNELRQTTLENYFKLVKRNNIVVPGVVKKKRLVQLHIEKFFRK